MTVQDQAPPRNIRLKGMLACETMLRLFRLSIEADYGGLEDMAIYLTVVAAGAARLIRDPVTRAHYAAATPVPDALRTPISRRAIAESLGLPRENVRRKVAGLIRRGDLVERDGGVVINGPALEHRANLAYVMGLLSELDRFADEIVRADKTEADHGHDEVG